MEPINLEPRYSTREIPGKCIRCLAEEELNNCLLKLLEAGGDDKDLQERFDLLVSFLNSPESEELRNDAEEYLAQGKKVTLKIGFSSGKPIYELKAINNKEESK